MLTCNPKQQRLVLTNKKSLVTCTQPVVTSYDHVSVDDVLEGLIVSVRQNGVVVVFFNDVKVSVGASRHQTLFYVTLMWERVE